jgi:hypothetical protein
MFDWLPAWLTAWQGLTPLMLLSSGLSAAFVMRLLLPPRRPPAILPSQFPVAAAPAPAAEHRFVVAARLLFGALPGLARWYPAPLSGASRRVYAGLEEETTSTLAGMHLIAAAVGMIIAGAALLGLHLLLQLPLTTVLWGTLAAGLLYGVIWPPSFVARRIQARDDVMATQLVPWVRDIQMQLGAKKPPLEAMRVATEVRSQAAPNPLSGQALDLYREAERLFTRLSGRQVSSASIALAEMVSRCHQVTVVNTLLAIQFAVEQGTPLEDMLRALEAGIVEEIETTLKILFERRQVQANALTTIVAFIVLVGVIAGFIVTQFIHAFAAVP